MTLWEDSPGDAVQKGHGGASGQLEDAFHNKLALAESARTTSRCWPFPCFVCPGQGTGARGFEHRL